MTDQPDDRSGANSPSRWLRWIAVAWFVVTMAWAPFPLGGAVGWGAGLLEIMIAVCWLFWLAANWCDPGAFVPRQRSVTLALCLAAAAVLWAVVQILPIVPTAWTHPIWQVASEGLGRPLPATISMNSWRTETGILALLTAMAASFLAYSMARRPDMASFLLRAVIAIGAAYAIYGFVLAFLRLNQAQLIYAVAVAPGYVTGPFMLHNSFATYEGLAALAAAAALFDQGRESIVITRGRRQFLLTAMHFVFGRGAVLLCAVVILFGAVAASASRGGFVALCVGLAAMWLLALVRLPRLRDRLWGVAALFALGAPLALAVLSSGGPLTDRVNQLLDAGAPDSVRLALWSAAWRMIQDSPWRGLGLGTFQDAYPLYATSVLPFVMDKAHCDYLEFAAGIGLPAAILWWIALAILTVTCVRGFLTRQRNRVFAITGFGAAILVATHSAVDFSLQIPAVALSFAVLLGVGVAQSARTVRSAVPD